MTEGTDVDPAHPVTRRQLRLQLVDGKTVVPDEAVGSLREPLPGGRRDRRRQGRGAVGGQPVDPVESVDPVEPDPAVLAQQRALAARAAELAARAQRMRGSAPHRVPGSSQPAPGSEDPAAAHNVAVLATPGFFLGTDESAVPSVSAPPTSHAADPPVPAASLRSPEPGPVSEPEPGPVSEPEPGPRPERIPEPEPGPVSEPEPEPATPGPYEDTDPIAARSAFGLDPLDATTAGLGRMRRLRYAQYSVLGVGAAALCTGIIMIVSSLNG